MSSPTTRRSKPRRRQRCDSGRRDRCVRTGRYRVVCCVLQVPAPGSSDSKPSRLTSDILNLGLPDDGEPAPKAAPHCAPLIRIGYRYHRVWPGLVASARPARCAVARGRVRLHEAPAGHGRRDGHRSRPGLARGAQARLGAAHCCCRGRWRAQRRGAEPHATRTRRGPNRHGISLPGYSAGYSAGHSAGLLCGVLYGVLYGVLRAGSRGSSSWTMT